MPLVLQVILVSVPVVLIPLLGYVAYVVARRSKRIEHVHGTGLFLMFAGYEIFVLAGPLILLEHVVSKEGGMPLAWWLVSLVSLVTIVCPVVGGMLMIIGYITARGHS